MRHWHSPAAIPAEPSGRFGGELLVTYIVSNGLKAEWAARKQYFCEAMGVVAPIEEHYPDYVAYISNLPTRQSFLFICGHNLEVSRFLCVKYQDYHPDITVITSCKWLGFEAQMARLQEVYFSETNLYGQTRLRNGQSFGFAFDITDSELKFFNDSDGSLLHRIQHSYWKAA